MLPTPCPHPTLPLTLPAARHRSLAATAIVLGCLLAACGGGGDSPPPSPQVATPVLNTLNPAGGAGFIEARTSMAPSDGALPTSTFDDFQLATAANISTVKWQGIYCVETTGSPAPSATATEFVISFHADVAGRPNTASVLAQARFTPAQAAQTADRTVSGLTCGPAANTTWSLFDYSATLPTAFAAAAGTRYWVRVQAVTPSYAVHWGWRAGTASNLQSLQLYNGTVETFALDRAIQLTP